MTDRVEIKTGETGPEAPNQPIYEGYDPNEPEATAEGEAQQAPEQQNSIPEKFILEDGSIDVDSLAKSYTELERMRSEVQPEQEVSEEPEEVQSGPESAVLSADEMQGFADEVLQDGDLTDESYSELETRGLSRELVQAYVEGQKALMDQARGHFVGLVGGEEAYEALGEWARNNLTEQEQIAYDDGVNSGDPATIEMNIKGLKARYDADSGSPNLIAGDVGTSGATQAFTSWQQVTAAMKDPRYQNDPSYRNEVTNRLAISDPQ